MADELIFDIIEKGHVVKAAWRVPRRDFFYLRKDPLRDSSTQLLCRSARHTSLQADSGGMRPLGLVLEPTAAPAGDGPDVHALALRPGSHTR